METTEFELIEPLTLEQKIETELVNHNVTRAVISSLKERYGNLKLKSIDDKESYLELKAAAKECSKIRNLAVKCCKTGRESAIKIQKLWVAKEKEVVSEILQIEDPLESEISKYDAEVDRKENEEKRFQEEAYMHRTQTLTKMGASYSEGTFSLGGFSIDANLVKCSSNDVWVDTMLPKFESEYNKIELERIEIERIQKEKDAEIERERQELARQQAEFKAKQEDFEKHQLELAKKEQQRIKEEEKAKLDAEKKLFQLRMSSLKDVVYNGIALLYKSKLLIPEFELVEMTDDDFALFSADHNSMVLKEHKLEEEKRLLEIEECKRIAAEQAAKKERERIEAEQKQAEINKQLEEQRKAEELSKAGDKANWENFIIELSKIHIPNFRSGQYRKLGSVAKEKIEEILTLKL